MEKYGWEAICSIRKKVMRQAILVKYVIQTSLTQDSLISNNFIDIV